MPFDRTQTVFSTGELDPRLHARIDIDRYRTSLAEAKDVMLTPQGPVKRRPGTVLDDDPDGFPTWLLPFRRAENASDTINGAFNFTGATNGTTQVSDNEADITDADYTHVYITAMYVDGADASSEFRARLEFWNGSEWIASPYARVKAASGQSNAQESAGGSLVPLSEDKDNGVEVHTYTKARLRIDQMPDSSVDVQVTASLYERASGALTPGNVRVAPFNVSETEQFLIVFTEYTAAVFERTESGNDRWLVQRAFISTPWSDDVVPDLDFAQAFDTMIVVEGGSAPRRILRDGDDRFWQIETITFDSDFVVEPEAIHVPQEPVNDSGADNAGQPAKWGFELQNLADGDRFQLAVDGEFTEKYAYDSSSASSNATNLQLDLNALPGFSGTFSVAHEGGEEYSVEYDFGDLSLQPVISDFEGLVLEGTGIISVWEIQKGIAHTNDKWSDALGWPRTVSLYQGRLWFGGSASYPDEIWGSRSEDLFSFWNASNLDNEAILAQIRSRQLLNIRAIYPGRNLQFFTDSAEFFAPQSLNDPLTPNTFIISRATNRGIATNIRPIEITGATMFMETSREAVREFLFVDTEQSYNAQDVSLLSSHLLVDPQTMKRWPATGGQEFDIVLVPNGTSGDMALFGSLRDQDIAGWWHWSGNWMDVEVMRDELYGVLRTDINGDDCNLLCYFDNDALMDLEPESLDTVKAISDGVIDGLYALKGKEVQIRVDGSFFDEATLDEAEDSRYTGDGNPQIDLDTVIDSSYQIGIPFTPKIKQLPSVIEVGGGSLIWMDRKKRVMGGIVDVIDTAAIEIATLDDESNAERYASEITISQNAPELTTGRVVFSGRLGWDDKAAVTITQPLPYPMQILAIQTRIDL